MTDTAPETPTPEEAPEEETTTLDPLSSTPAVPAADAAATSSVTEDPTPSGEAATESVEPGGIDDAPTTNAGEAPAPVDVQPQPVAQDVLLPTDGPHDTREAAALEEARKIAEDVEHVAVDVIEEVDHLLDPSQTSPQVTSSEATTPTDASSADASASTSDATTEATSSTPPTATDPNAATA